MTDLPEFQVGDCVRLICDLPVAAAGTEGVIKAVKRDDNQQIMTLTIFVCLDPAHTYGTGVFPHEVEIVRRAEPRDGEGS
jgi:hypothetical protein